MELTLKNVVLGYPRVFTPEKFGDGTGSDEPKYSTAIVLHKKRNAAEIKQMEAGVKAVRADKKLASVKTLTGKPLLRDGSERTDEESESGFVDGFGPDVLYFNASNTRKPRVVGGNKKDLREEDDLIYGGVVANVIVRLWPQNNGFGKRVNASLEAIQRAGEGTHFGAPSVDVEKKFEEISGEDDENP